MLGKVKKAVKNALAVPAVRRGVEGAQRGTLEVFASTRLGATLYSLPGFITFNREQYATLAGRRAYYRQMGTQRKTHVELRRNIHRLEKGLIMEPRRPVFARDYIGETLEFYRDAMNEGNLAAIDSVEAMWAHNVLENYFSVVDTADAVVGRAAKEFAKLPLPATTEIDRHTTPYTLNEAVPQNVSYDEFLKLTQHRRSVRWFQDKPVPRDLLDKAFRAAREAPTACNRMPYEYLVFDDPELVKRVAAIPFGAEGYSKQIPALIVVKGNLDSYFSPRDRHAPYIDSALASMQFMLALETLGLNSVVINWPDFEPLEAKMQKTLGLEPYERVMFLIAVGYGREDGMVPSSVKKSLSVLREYNATGE